MEGVRISSVLLDVAPRTCSILLEEFLSNCYQAFSPYNYSASMCCILTLDRAVNLRSTCVNKWKKKRKQVDVMKEYRQVPATFDIVGDRKVRVRASLQTEGCGPQRFLVEQPSQDAEEVLLWSREEIGSI